MTAEEKKAWLKQYACTERRINRLLAEKAEWMSKAEAVTQVYSSQPRAPGGAGGGRIPRSVEKIMELEQQIDAEIDRKVDMRTAIENAIAGVADEKLQDVLRMKYIDGKTIEEIADDMNYDLRWVKRLHARAIDQLATVSHPTSVV